MVLTSVRMPAQKMAAQNEQLRLDANEANEELLAVLRPRMALAARRLTEEERSLREGSSAEWPRSARERRIAHLQADIAWLQGLMGHRIVQPSRELARRAG